LQREISEDANVWNDQSKATIKLKEISALKVLIDGIEELKAEIELYKEVLQQKEDYEMYIEEIEQLFIKIEEYEIKSLLNGDYDNNNAVVEIHAGAGGTESCDWVSMLYRMYQRWCDKKGYKYQEIGITFGEEAGIRSVTFKVQGEKAFGYLKSEKGVHRLVRISPFDSGGRRHTSFAALDVIPELDDLSNDIDIKEKDLKIDVYHSSGAGGQSVNTTDSAVRITHIPTGIVVTCQNERSQLKNKEQALKILKGKLIILKEEAHLQTINELKGIKNEINFGNQIRSYVMCPYTLVKDTRTNMETSSVDRVLDGEIDLFIEAYLKGVKNETV